MLNFKKSDIPSEKFSNITVGNNGIRIDLDNPIYIRKEDLVGIYNHFIASAANNTAHASTVATSTGTSKYTNTGVEDNPTEYSYSGSDDGIEDAVY